MTKRIVPNCVDCGDKLSYNYRKNKHHFRCEKCWYDYKDKIALTIFVEKEK